MQFLPPPAVQVNTPQQKGGARSSLEELQPSKWICSSALAVQDGVPFVRGRNEDYFPNVPLIAEKDELAPIKPRLH